MTPDLQQVLDSALRTDLNAFTDKTLSFLLGPNYLPNWHIRAMTAALQRMIDGKNRFLIILVQPRMGKSLVCSVALPAFLMMRDPSCKIMALSYSAPLCAKLHNQTRNVVRAPWCRRLNPELNFQSKKGEQTVRDSETTLETTKGSQRYSTSFGGTIRGEGADWTIMDDPEGVTAASSEAERKKAIEIFKESIASRLDSKTGRIVLVMQRVHFGDLAGHLMDLGGYEVLKIPAIAEEDEIYDLGGGHQYHRPKGSLIDERRFDEAEMQRLRRDLGSEAFETQYQQNPAPPDGQIFKRGWLKFVDTVPHPEHILVSADIAGSEERGDYSVILVWLIRDGVWYLTHCYRERLDFVDLVKLMQRIDQEHEPDLIVFERNGLGAPLYSRLWELGLRNIDAQSVSVSKQDRAAAITPFLEKGMVAILRTMPGCEAFLQELLTFPSSPYFDQVDAFTFPLFFLAGVKKVLRGRSPRQRKADAKTTRPRPARRPWPAQRSTDRVVNRYAERNRGSPFFG